MSADAAKTSKALVNGAWREAVNIRSTKSVKNFCWGSRTPAGQFAAHALSTRLPGPTRSIEPGIHNHHREYSFRARAYARPGMTERELRLARDRLADRGLRRGQKGGRHAKG